MKPPLNAPGNARTWESYEFIYNQKIVKELGMYAHGLGQGYVQQREVIISGWPLSVLIDMTVLMRLSKGEAPDISGLELKDIWYTKKILEGMEW